MDKEKIIGIIKRLTISERMQFMELLKEYTYAEKITSVANTISQNRRIECSKCSGTENYGHDKYRGRSRYQCKTCSKTFNNKHHTFIASKQHIKDKCFHIQHLNFVDNRVECWQKHFYGVATKYLQNYLKWFVFLAKVKNSYDRLVPKYSSKI
jgi:transposase-like protein